MEQPHIPTHSHSFEDPGLYFSREISWLAFNDRVLAEACDARNPLLERLKFLAIFSTNLDEYFMVRVAGLKQQVEAEIVKRSDDGRLPAEHLREIEERLRPSLRRHADCLIKTVLPALAERGVSIETFSDQDEEARKRLRALFIERVFPLLTPLAVDPSHPFPYISNLSLSLAVEIRDENVGTAFARVKVPNSLPRFLPLEARGAQDLRYIMLEDLIASNLDMLFPGVEVVGAWPFRITRDADLDLQEDEADDLLGAIETELRRRRFGELVRLEVASAMPSGLRTRLLSALELGEEDLYASEGPLSIGDFWTIVNLDLPELHDAPFMPAVPKRLAMRSDLFEAIREGDILLHHPYEAFDPVLHFVRQAAQDPSVLAIKQTLYRTSGSNSPILAALIEAAENGKQVAVMIELKARFDEENNIKWARRLEHVGAHVAYSKASLKTHAKMALVVRDEPGGLRRYVHIGTGNYNERSAKTYTDFSLFSCRPQIGADVSSLFNALTGISKNEQYGELLVAPAQLRSKLLALIARETRNSEAGLPSGITAKFNALTDGEIIRALYRASQAGVQVELVVRGVCALRPGVRGVSETIRVRSIVGRFLEHSRVFVFANAGSREVYIGSADWMSRNLDRRVEILVPIHDQGIADNLAGRLFSLLCVDNSAARILYPDGSYERLKPVEGERRINAQSRLLRDAGAVVIDGDDEIYDF
jgi:polyphosphate kinase